MKYKRGLGIGGGRGVEGRGAFFYFLLLFADKRLAVLRAKSHLYIFDVFLFNVLYILHGGAPPPPRIYALAFLHFLLRLKRRYGCAAASALCIIC